MIDQARLAESVGELDAGTRALLDLSLRRAIPDEQVASVLGVEAASIPPRRARGIAQLADMMEVPGPSELAALLIAIPELPEAAWGVPVVVAPFSGRVSSARRARAFRRTAVAASPLVALGAVIAAIAVSSGSDGGHPRSGPAGRGASGAAAGLAGLQASISSPAPRHGLPPGVPLTPVKTGKAKSAHTERAAAKTHRARHHAAANAELAVAARHRSEAPHAERVVFHHAAPAPVQHAQPHHVSHHHAPHASPAPTHHPSAPVAVPAPAPAPVQHPAVQHPAVQVSAPQTHVAPSSAPRPSAPATQGPHLGHGGEGNGGGHGNGHAGGNGNGNNGHHYGQLGEVPRGRAVGAKKFTPPGLFKRRHGRH